MSAFWIVISSSAGVAYGEIRSAQGWESDDVLDRAGRFRFTMPAGDSKAALVQPKLLAVCYTIINSTVVEVGSGVIDTIRASTGSGGEMLLDVEGDNILRELTYRQVGDLVIDDGAGGVDTSGPADIIALAPAGWSLDVVTGYNATAKAILHAYEGELALNAFVRLAELTGEHFRVGVGRKLIWMQNDQPDSGVRAVGSADPIAIEDSATICLITGIEEVEDTYDLCSRIYPFGAGEGAARIVIDIGTAWGGAVGYTMVNADGYIKYDAQDAALRIDRYVSFKDIQDDDMLAEQAYEWLRVHCTDEKFYNLTLVGLNTVLTPGSTLRVVYHRWVDAYHAIDIDDDGLIILSVTNRIDNKGLRTARLTCGTIDRHPDSDSQAVVGGMVQAGNYYTHPQPLDTDDLDVPPAPMDAQYLVVAASASLTDERVMTVPAANLLKATDAGAGLAYTLQIDSDKLSWTSGKLTIGVTAGKTLTLAAADNYTVTFPATGTAALLNQANSFTLINPLTTIAESWIGPSATTGVYFKGGKVGIGTITPTGTLSVFDAVDCKIKAQGVHPGMQFTNTSATLASRFFTNTDTGNFYIQVYKSAAWTTPITVVSGAPNNAIYILASGRIGLNTTTPGSRLHILESNITTAAVDGVVTIGHNSTGTPAAGFGSRLLWQLQTNTTPNTDAACIDVPWEIALHGTRTSNMVFSLVSAGGALTEYMKLTPVGLGIGITPTSPLHVKQTAVSGANAAHFETFTTGVNTYGGVCRYHRISTGDMVDGFGATISFNIEDNAAVRNTIGEVGYTRYGADNSGRFEIFPYLAGTRTSRVVVLPTGEMGINEPIPDYLLDVNGTFGFTPGASVTPVDNGDVVIEATNNTTLTLKLKGSDGTVRSVALTLA